MKLLVTRRLPDAVFAALDGRFDFDVRDNTTPMTAKETNQAMKDYDLILPTLGDDFSQSAFDGSLLCKMLANFGVGYNHIDVGTASDNGIAVTNTPGAVTDATADIALSLMLSTARRTGEGERMVRAGNWSGWHPTQMLGFHMSGKTVGIIGMGRIGQAIAQRCRLGFGMTVKFFNRSVKSVERCEQVDDLLALVQQVDFIIAAIPGGPATRHLINADVFDAMPKHGFFINIARGDVVDEVALINALKSRSIAGVGLDVYEHEPAVPDALLSMENVVLYPHLGTATLEVRTDMGLMAVANLIAYKDGAPLPNLVMS